MSDAASLTATVNSRIDAFNPATTHTLVPTIDTKVINITTTAMTIETVASSTIALSQGKTRARDFGNNRYVHDNSITAHERRGRALMG